MCKSKFQKEEDKTQNVANQTATINEKIAYKYQSLVEVAKKKSNNNWLTDQVSTPSASNSFACKTLGIISTTELRNKEERLQFLMISRFHQIVHSD